MPRKPTTVFERAAANGSRRPGSALRARGLGTWEPCADESRMWVTPSAKPKPGNEQTYVSVWRILELKERVSDPLTLCTQCSRVRSDLSRFFTHSEISASLRRSIRIGMPGSG